MVAYNAPFFSWNFAMMQRTHLWYSVIFFRSLSVSWFSSMSRSVLWGLQWFYFHTFFLVYSRSHPRVHLFVKKYLVSFVLKINVEKQGSRASSNVLTCGRKVYYYLLLVNLAESRCLKITGHVNKGWTVLFARNYWSWDRSQPHPWRKLTKADIRQVFWRTPYFRKTLRILFERWLKHFEHFWIPISSRFHLWLVLCFFLPRGTVAGVY